MAQLVDGRIRLALLEHRIAELAGDRVHKTLHQGALGAEVVGSQPAAIAGALTDVGERDPAWADLADELGGCPHESAFGVDTTLLLRAGETGLRHRHSRPA